MSRLLPLLALAVTSLAFSQQPTFTPFDAAGIYHVGERAGWNVSFPSGSTAIYNYSIKTNNRDEVKTGALDPASSSGTIETILRQAAMLYVEVRPAGDSGASVKPIHLGAAVDPWDLPLSTPRPPDFDAFWDAKLQTLAEVPMNPVLTPTPIEKEPKGEKVEFYTVKLNSLNSHVQGYLAKPAREGKFPALVIFQYAGVYALRPNTVLDRAAEGWLAFDVDSHDIPPNQPGGVSTSYAAIGNKDRETSYFLNMYLRDSRAIDYISTRPDWDGKTIFIMGTSMGGQQSLVTAGLNSKVTGVLINEPSGADTNGDLHGRKAGYPNWPSNDPEVMKTALYFDPVNFASRIKVPVIAAIGFIDTTSPPAGVWTAVNQVHGPTEVIPMIESDHNNRTPEKQDNWNTRSKEVLHTLMTGGTLELHRVSTTSARTQ
jgi:cephalosporin-C deacetylase